MISAFMCGCGLSIGQKEVGEKTNEIPEIPKILDLIDITECFVTIDAIGTQKDIMDKIKEKKGHFCLQLKRNQKNAFEDVELFFSDMEKNNSREFSEMDYYMQEEKNHGRIEKREYRVFTGQEEIKRVLDTKWGHVGCLGMAKFTRKKRGTVSVEIHYHLLNVAVSEKNTAAWQGNIGRLKTVSTGFWIFILRKTPPLQIRIMPWQTLPCYEKWHLILQSWTRQWQKRLQRKG